MSYDSDLAQVRRKAEAQGWRYDLTSSGHPRFYSPNKKDIVVTSGTPGDVNAWNNFMSNMKRAGYVDDPGAIGLALLAATKKEEKKELLDAALQVSETKQAQTVPGAVRQIFQRHKEEVMNFDGIAMRAMSMRPGTTRNAISMALHDMTKKGEITRLGRGEYKYGSHHVNINPQPAAPNPQPPPQAPPIPQPPSPSQALGSALGVMSGDPAVDADLKIMDDALAAIARIEEVVKRNRERLLALAQFKKLMGG